MTDLTDRLDEIEARAEAATRGPWEWRPQVTDPRNRQVRDGVASVLANGVQVRALQFLPVSKNDLFFHGVMTPKGVGVQGVRHSPAMAAPARTASSERSSDSLTRSW